MTKIGVFKAKKIAMKFVGKFIRFAEQRLPLGAHTENMIVERTLQNYNFSPRLSWRFFSSSGVVISP